MAYHTEKNGDDTDIVIDGWEKGIAPSPHKGIANIQNANISTETNEVVCSFSRAKQTQTPIVNGTLTTVSSPGSLWTSSSPLQAGQWINVTAVNGVQWTENPTTTTIPTIVAYGAGGGGGGYYTDNTRSGGGGGGGAFSQKNNFVASIASYTVTVGAHGNGGGNNTDGTDGTDSSFKDVSTLLAKAGKKGIVNNTAGLGGLASAGVGDVKYNGGDGGTGAAAAAGGGGGGGGAGTTGAGGSAIGAGHAAGTTIGGGDGGDGSTGTTGGTGQLAGGGGGGGSFFYSSSSGGPGADGKVVITYPTGQLTATGGTITTVGGNTVHTFTSSGTFQVTAITPIVHNMSTGLYYVSYFNGTQIKLSSFFDPSASVSVFSYTTGGSVTFTTVNFSSPVAQATEKYNNTSGVQYRYYVLDSAGLVWVYDTGLYASTLISFGVGVTWFLPDTSTSYWDGANPSGLGVLNGWLMVFPGNTIQAKPTVNLGDTTSNSTTYRPIRFTTSAGTDNVYLMSEAETTNVHFALVGHQGRLYYTDGNFVGSIFPDTSLLTSSPNVQSYVEYTAATNVGTITVVIGGSVPFVNSSQRFPAVFFPSAGGTLAADLTADTVFWIDDYSGENSTFRVYSAETGGSPLDIETGAIGDQYFNGFFPVGDSASAGSDTPTLTLQTQRVTLPFFEISQSLVEIGNYVLIGCTGNVVYPWTQVEAIPSGLISLPESGVTTMVTVNQMAYIFAGTNGNIYVTDGSTASLVLNLPDYCAGVPGSPGTYIEPNYYWGGAMYLRGRVYFSVRDQVSGKAGNCGGIWSFYPTQNLYIGQDTGLALRLEAQNSYGNYNGVCPLLIPSQVQTSPSPLYWSPWYSSISAPTYGIDYTNPGTSATSVAVIETDWLPVGTMLNKKTFNQVEYKLGAVLDTGATVTAKYRLTTTDAWVSLDTFITDTAKLSGYVKVNFMQSQWLQLQFTLTPVTSSADTNTFIRFKEIRIR